MKIDTFKSKLIPFKIKIEKCLKNEKNARLLHAQIRPVQINGLIMRPSCPRPAKRCIEELPHDAKTTETYTAFLLSMSCFLGANSVGDAEKSVAHREWIAYDFHIILQGLGK